MSKIKDESSTIRSFGSNPKAGKKPEFLAGQHITIKSTIDGKPKIRNYTVSSAPQDESLRISIKKDGNFSSWLYRAIKATVDIKAVWLLTRPELQDEKDKHYSEKGRLNKEIFQQLLQADSALVTFNLHTLKKYGIRKMVAYWSLLNLMAFYLNLVAEVALVRLRF